MVREVPSSTANVPPPAPSVVARAEAKVAVVFRVPPSRVSVAVWSPRLLSWLIRSVPPETVVPPR